MDSTNISRPRRDVILADFRSHANQLRAIREESFVRHCHELERAEARKRKEKQFFELTKEAQECRQEKALRKIKQDTIEGIDRAEANLCRLGLDAQSAMHGRHYTTQSSPQDTVDRNDKTRDFKPKPESSISKSMVAGRRIVLGITSLLRRVNEELDTDDVNLYRITTPVPPSNRRLQPPKPLYPPTVAKQDVDNDSTDSEEISPPPVTLSANDEYMAEIRNKKQADRIAKKERDLLRYKLSAEQTESKNQDQERKELAELLISAKNLNKDNREKAIRNCIHRVRDQHEREKRDRTLQLQRTDRSKATSVALATVAMEAEQELKIKHEAFLRDHEQWQEAANLKKQQNDEKVRDYCRFLAKGIINLVEMVIEKSTTKLSDGSTHYKRVQFGVSEWRDVIDQAFKNKSSILNEECQNKSPGIVSELQERASLVKPCDAKSSQAVDELVGYDVIHFMAQHDVSKKLENMNKFPNTSALRCIYVSGDPDISGVTLISQCPDNLVNLCSPKAYLVISPRLIFHLFYQRVIMDIDRDIADVEDKITSIKAELVSKQAIVTIPHGKNVKGKESRKDQNPNAAIITQLNNQISDLQKKSAGLHSSRVQFESESEEDAKHLDKDSLLQLLTQLAELMSLRCDDGQEVNNEKETVPLSLSLMASHPALAETTYIFAGFEELGIGPSDFRSLFEFWPFAHCTLDCTIISRLERLSARRIFRKTFPPLPATVVPVESRKRRDKKIKSLSQLLEVREDLQPPQNIVVHPLLSPLEISKPNTEYTTASSPFLKYSDRSSDNTVFIRSLSWEDAFGDDPFENLYQYVNAKEAQPLLLECSVKCEIDDLAMNLLGNFSFPNLVPGEETSIFYENDDIHLVSAKLCAEIMKSCSTLKVEQLCSDINNSTDVETLTSVIRNIRDKQCDALLAITNLVNYAVAHFSDTNTCYPRDQFLVAPTELTTDTLDGLEFARWKQANAQMCRDQHLFDSLCDQTKAEVDQAICDFRDISENARASFSGAFAQILSVEAYILEAFETVKLAITEWTLHMFKLHCDLKTDTDQNVFFSACSKYRPKDPHQLLSIIYITPSGFSPRPAISLFPEEQSAVLSAVQVKSLMWTFKGLPRLLDKVQFQHCLAMAEFIGVHLPSFCPSGLRCDWVEGPVSVDWALTAMSLGRLSLEQPIAIPYPDILQAREMLLDLLSLPKGTPSLEQWSNLQWWFVNRRATNALWMIFCASDDSFNPINCLHFLLGSKTRKKCLLLLKQWFSCIELIERSKETQSTNAEFTLTPKQLEIYFPSGMFKEIDGQLLAYFSGQQQPGSVSFHMISTSNYGKAMVKQMDFCFPHFVSN